VLVRADLSAEEVVNVAPAVDDMHDLDTRVPYPVEDDVLSHGEAAIYLAKLIAVPASIRMPTKDLEMVDEQVDEAVGGALVVSSYVLPDFK